MQKACTTELVGEHIPKSFKIELKDLKSPFEIHVEVAGRNKCTCSHHLQI